MDALAKKKEPERAAPKPKTAAKGPSINQIRAAIQEVYLQSTFLSGSSLQLTEQDCEPRSARDEGTARYKEVQNLLERVESAVQDAKKLFK